MGAIILIICLALLAFACYSFLKRHRIVEEDTAPTTNPTPPTTTTSTGGGGGAHRQNTSESIEPEGKYRDPATGRYAKRPEI